VDLHIDAKALQDMSLIFSRSKIVLNKTMADDLNQRVFEVLGSGAFLLTNRIDARAGLEDLFTDGKHLVIYENQEHLLELIRYYLDHDEERESIAAAGHKEALEKHTYDARVVDIIRTVQEDIHGS
jgi:spore maturation protein CgeB